MLTVAELAVAVEAARGTAGEVEDGTI
jgi:hypothetical protein